MHSHAHFDVCNSDASDTFDFNVAVANYLENKIKKIKLFGWIFLERMDNSECKLIALSNNTALIQQFYLYQSLSDLSEQILLVLEKNKR
jgi:hypothetical protein